jgi:hypothetical protein
MRRIQRLRTGFGNAKAGSQAAAFAMLGVPMFAASSNRPNILLIMSDDMGFSDIGC